MDLFRKATQCGLHWNKGCVEVSTGEKILVRDSKNPDAGTLEFTHDEWKTFIGGVKSGEFDV